jgi:hypothetical protein
VPDTVLLCAALRLTALLWPGDHLYAKAEYEGAMAQYLETIGSDLEPSYVIRRCVMQQEMYIYKCVVSYAYPWQPQRHLPQLVPCQRIQAKHSDNRS